MRAGATMNDNLFALFRSRMPAPGKAFLEAPQGRTISYGDAIDLSGRFAQALVDLGVAPGDRVAVQVAKSPEALILYLACLRAGAVYLPLNTDYTGAELAYFLSDSEPTVIVCDPAKRPELEDISAEAGVPNLETLGADGAGSITDKAAGAAPDFADRARRKDDLAAILYTSGTTGRSKGAMLTHANLASNAKALAAYWRFSTDDVLLHALPIFHTHGLFVATNVTLIAGAAMIFLPRFDLDEVLRLLPEATTMMGVPTFYTRLLSSPDFTQDLVGHIRLFVSGSAPLSPETHKAFEERTGHAILERYGMTETGMNTSNPYDGPRRAGTVGIPLPGVEIRIADRKTGRALPQGEVGMIEVRGPNVFKGYWRMPEKTDAEFRDDGFFITGDLGLIDDQGYVNIVGRDKDLIISGGYNVYPAEVEAALDAIKGVAESAVVGVAHADFGEGVTAVVAARSGAQLTEEEIRETLQTHLARYKVPKRVFFVDQLPRNKMGKIQKNVLREKFQDAYRSP
jgi:malonyl-CoA/methylmalonyl-CoA synthetase